MPEAIDGVTRCEADIRSKPKSATATRFTEKNPVIKDRDDNVGAGAFVFCIVGLKS